MGDQNGVPDSQLQDSPVLAMVGICGMSQPDDRSVLLSVPHKKKKCGDKEKHDLVLANFLSLFPLFG